MKVQLTSSNGTARRLAVLAFAQEAREACQPGNLVPLPDQGSVRHVDDRSQQRIADQTILHPYTSQPPGSGQVIRDCDVVLKGLERFQGDDVQAIKGSVQSYCSRMSKLSLLSVAGGVALGAGLSFAGLGLAGAAAGLLPAIGGIVYAERGKSGAREFERQLDGWNSAIQTGNPHRLPIPEEDAVSFEYVFMVEKGHIGVSRQYRMPTTLLMEPSTWTGVEPTSSRHTLVPPQAVAELDLSASRKTGRWGKFDGPAWPETDVRVPEPLEQTARLAGMNDRSGAPAVGETGGRVTVGGIAVRKKRPKAG